MKLSFTYLHLTMSRRCAYSSWVIAETNMLWELTAKQAGCRDQYQEKTGRKFEEGEIISFKM